MVPGGTSGLMSGGEIACDDVVVSEVDSLFFDVSRPFALCGCRDRHNLLDDNYAKE